MAPSAPTDHLFALRVRAEGAFGLVLCDRCIGSGLIAASGRVCSVRNSYQYFADRNVAMGIAGMASLWAAGFVIPRLNGTLGMTYLGYPVVPISYSIRSLVVAIHGSSHG